MNATVEKLGRCFRCDYDLHDRKVPAVCSECGLPITKALLDGLLPWEESSEGSVLKKWRDVLLQIALDPRKAFRRLAMRRKVPIFRSESLIQSWIAAHCLCVLLFSQTYRVIVQLRWAYRWGFRWRDLWLAIRPNWYTIKRYMISVSGIWILLWLASGLVVSVVLGRRWGVLTWKSSLAILGPMPLFFAVVGCVYNTSEMFLPDSVMFLTPYIRLLGLVSGLALYACHLAMLVAAVSRGSGGAPQGEVSQGR